MTQGAQGHFLSIHSLYPTPGHTHLEQAWRSVLTNIHPVSTESIVHYSLFQEDLQGHIESSRWQKERKKKSTGPTHFPHT